MLLTNEFATMINADNDHQIIKNNSNNNGSTNNRLADLQSQIHSQTQQHIYKVKSNAEITHNNITAIHSNKNDLPPASARSPAQRKRLHDDGINISNQRYELNERPPAAKAATVATSAVNNSVSTMYGIPAALLDLDRQGDDVVYKLSRQQQEENEAKIAYKKTPANTELLLHRQKRYLVFPEGSSFQMVFDLIIGVVDYTSYAILGITCAVAWELPSKPPSELIENLHEKVTEGIYQTSATKTTTTATATAAMRRNDSITATAGGDGGGDNSKYGIDSASITYVDNANVAAQFGSNYRADALHMKVETAQLPSPINTLESPYYTKANPFMAPPAGYSGYRKGTEEWSTHDSTAYGAYRPTNYYTNIPHGNYNNNNMDNNLYGRVTHKYGFADKNEKSSYYDVSNSYGINNNNSNNNNNRDKRPFGDSRDKLPVKFANRWQQQQQSPYKKWQSWRDYDSKSWHSYQQPQQQQQQQQKQATKWAHQPQKQQIWSAQTKYVGKDNWWSSNNKHYATDNWRTKPEDWQANNVRNHEAPMQPRHPVVAYAPPSETTQATINSKSDAFEGRSFDESQRSVLTARPKARIYPVFGRRRRRRSSDTKLHDFEHKLERIHLREQLRTRQKLYGKIEKLYETRGLNGTACVLRALCETGQQHKGGRTEPQSFITELLRAIFVLPTTSRNHVSDTVSFEEPALHPTDLHIVDRPYREAPTHHGSCSQLFSMCEHSIWE
ncbi:type-2 histone deacetylase 1 [Ceratitis capitata]|uniref:type-2 histone deacetylase 1 n=1 Tax=Ceratitis capitata TaxID=7213 RepID=UPI0006187E31|nr:type-2 histone deacetylase 1 [Ceratitis capitata]